MLRAQETSSLCLSDIEIQQVDVSTEQRVVTAGLKKLEDPCGNE